jgi:hypothetical protein
VQSGDLPPGASSNQDQALHRAVLEGMLEREMDKLIEKLKYEGKVLHDPFDGHDYFVEE